MLEPYAREYSLDGTTLFIEGVTGPGADGQGPGVVNGIASREARVSADDISTGRESVQRGESAP